MLIHIHGRIAKIAPWQVKTKSLMSGEGISSQKIGDEPSSDSVDMSSAFFCQHVSDRIGSSPARRLQ